MNDNADLPDTGSQVNNSFEKSDDDMFSVKMANIGGEEPPVETKSVKIDRVGLQRGPVRGRGHEAVDRHDRSEGRVRELELVRQGRGDRQPEGRGHPEEGRQGHDHREVRDQDLVDHRDRDR